MRSSRLTALVLLAGLVAGGLLLDAADEPSPSVSADPAVVAGVALPAATAPGTLSSTWYCAGGSATERGIADHVLLIANPTDEAREASVTALRGVIAPPPVEVTDQPTGTDATTTTTTTEAPTTTTTPPTTTTAPPPEPTVVELPPLSRVEVAVSDLVDAPLAGAVVEVDGGEVAVEHQITGVGGRATAPCSTTAAVQWSFPWGETPRGARELLVFMNPFPDDATVDVDLATDEGTRQPLRFQGFVVPGRSVVGAYVDEDTRRDQVSAQVHVRSGRLVVDRIQIFNGTNPSREGITLGLGAPTPAKTWIFPDGKVDAGITERIVVFNPTEEVAEVEVAVRLDDPDSNDVPEAFELTIPPSRYSLVDLDQPEEGLPEGTPRRIPDGIPHSIIVTSLNGVPMVAERVVTSSEPNGNVGIASTMGSPVAAPTWFFPGGGVTAERDEVLTLFNQSDAITTFSLVALADGQTLALEGLQDLEVAAGARRSIRLSDHVGNREVLPIVVAANGPVVVERGLYRVGGRGISLSMGIPLAVGVVVPEPLAS